MMANKITIHQISNEVKIICSSLCLWIIDAGLYLIVDHRKFDKIETLINGLTKYWKNYIINNSAFRYAEKKIAVKLKLSH